MSFEKTQHSILQAEILFHIAVNASSTIQRKIPFSSNRNLGKLPVEVLHFYGCNTTVHHICMMYNLEYSVLLGL